MKKKWTAVWMAVMMLTANFVYAQADTAEVFDSVFVEEAGFTDEDSLKADEAPEEIENMTGEENNASEDLQENLNGSESVQAKEEEAEEAEIQPDTEENQTDTQATGTDDINTAEQAEVSEAFEDGTEEFTVSEEAETSVVGTSGDSSLSAARLADLQSRFPDGKYWNHLCTDPSTTRSEEYQDSVTDHVCSHLEITGNYDCNHFDGAGQCWGYARKLAYEYYGVYFSQQPISYDVSELKAGDIVRYKPGSQEHSIWVTAVSGDTVTYTDCNYVGECQIRWNGTTTKAEINKTLVHIESAPDEIDFDGVLDTEDGATYIYEDAVLYGWAVQGKTVSEVTCVINGTDVYQAAHYQRTDVKEKYAFLETDQVGFQVVVPKETLKFGENTYRVTGLDKDGGERLLREGSFTYQGNVKITDAEYNFWTKGSQKLKFSLWKNGTWSNYTLGSEGSLKSSDSSIASVSRLGIITGKKKGTVTISGTVKNPDGVAIPVSCKVNIKKLVLKLNKSSVTLKYVGKTETLKATVEGPGKKVKWTTSNKKIAVVSSSGKVTAKGVGKCTITASANGLKASCKITVSSKALLELSQKSASLYVGQSKTVTAKYNGSKCSPTWKSSNTKVAAVKKGVITAKKAGKATITAVYKGKKVKCTVKVVNPSIKLNKKSVTLKLNGTKTVTLKATVKGPESKVTWKSSAAGVASVTSNGKVTAKKAGTAVITASANGKTARCTVKVKAAELPAGAVEYNGHIYKYYSTSMTWSEASQKCGEMGGYLVDILSSGEQEFLTENLPADSVRKNCYWIGLYYSDGWKWTSGKTYSYENWATSEPNDYNSKGEGCAHLCGRLYTAGNRKNIGEWNDCSNSGAEYANAFFKLENYGYICEWDSVNDIK